jgi:hypothetical protein
LEGGDRWFKSTCPDHFIRGVRFPQPAPDLSSLCDPVTRRRSGRTEASEASNAGSIPASPSSLASSVHRGSMEGSRESLRGSEHSLPPAKNSLRDDRQFPVRVTQGSSLKHCGRGKKQHPARTTSKTFPATLPAGRKSRLAQPEMVPAQSRNSRQVHPRRQGYTGVAE